MSQQLEKHHGTACDILQQFFNYEDWYVEEY